MSKPNAAPPPQATGAVPEQAQSYLPEPMDIPSPHDGGSLSELGSPDFPELSLPSEAHADIGLPAAELPDFFVIDGV